MYVHTNTQLQRGSISCISYVSALGKMGLGPGTFKGIIFNWRWLHLCLWSHKMLGFLCLPLVFPGGCVGKWTKQKCRNLWLLWRQRQPRVRREKGEPTFFFPSGVQSSFVKTEKLLLPTQRTSSGGLGSPWVLLLAGYSPRELFCHKSRGRTSPLLIPSETGYRGVGSPKRWELQGSRDPQPSAQPLLSAWGSPLPCRDGGLCHIGALGAPWSHPGQRDLECCSLHHRGLAAASRQLSRLSALGLMALLPGKMKYTVGQ